MSWGEIAVPSVELGPHPKASEEIMTHMSAEILSFVFIWIRLFSGPITQLRQSSVHLESAASFPDTLDLGVAWPCSGPRARFLDRLVVLAMLSHLLAVGLGCLSSPPPPPSPHPVCVFSGGVG